LLKNKDISELIVDRFELSLEVSEPDKAYRDFVGDEFWDELYSHAITKINGICQGCNFNPPDKDFLELHVISGEIQNPDTYKTAMLCKTCHTLQHIDIASEKGWIKLCNSMLNQKQIIFLCRSGNARLKEKLNSGEIILLEQNPMEYSQSLGEDVFNKRKKMKAVFGSKFPKNRLK
jgi:hypothetical protein